VAGRLQAFTGNDEYGITVGADLDAFADDYIILSEDQFLLNRDLDVATTKGFQFADGGNNGWVLTEDGSGLYVPGPVNAAGIAGLDAQFVTMALSADLANERVLTAGNSISVTDGGAGSTVTLALATPGTLSVSSANAAAAPHTHAVTSSSNPGAAASLLATDATGALSITGDLSLGAYMRHIGDTDTYLCFQNDQFTISVGNLAFLDLVEGATDYIQVGTQVRMLGNILYLDGDNDSYLYASNDDVVDFVLAGASGELGITINGAEDFKFTANAFTLQEGSGLYLPDRIYHLGDLDTYMLFGTNSISFYAGGLGLLHVVETGIDYIAATAEILIGSGWPGAGAYVEIRASGDETTEADIWFDGNGAISAEGSMIMLIDSDNDSSTAVFEVAMNADSREEAVSGVSLWKVTEDNAQVMRLSTVGHGATSIFKHSDAFFQLSNVSGTAGGTLLSGGADNSEGDGGGALVLRGVLADNADTTKTTAGRALVEVYGSEVSGTSFGDLTANGNVWCVRARRSSAWATVAIIDEDGDFYYDGALNNYDTEDDALAIADLQRGLTGRWEQTLAYNQDKLQAMGILGQGDNPLVSHRGVTALMAGAIAQLAERTARLERLLDGH